MYKEDFKTVVHYLFMSPLLNCHQNLQVAEVSTIECPEGSMNINYIATVEECMGQFIKRPSAIMVFHIKYLDQ